MRSPHPPALLTLRPCRREDLIRLVSWVDSPAALFRWAGPAFFRYPLDESQLDAYYRASNGPGTRIFTGLAPDGTPVGHCELSAIHPDQRTATVCRVIIDPARRGEGWCVAMIRSLLHLAFGMLDLRRLDLKVYADNTPGVRCYERAGFVREGVLRQAVIVEAGTWDTVVMGLLREEWSGKHAGPGEPCSPQTAGECS